MAPHPDPGTTTYETVGDRELVITRVFAAPVQAVFDAWTDPQLVPQWLGPAKHRMTTCVIDLQVGGTYRYVWSLADGGSMGMGGTFDELDAPHRFTSTETYDDFPGESVNTVELIQDGDRTVCRCSALYSSPEGLRGSLDSGMQGGIDEGYARLDTLLR